MGDFCIRCGKKNNTNGNVCSACLNATKVPVNKILTIDRETDFMTITSHVFISFFKNLHLWFVLVLFSMMISLFPILGQMINFFLFSYFKKSFGLTSLKNSFQGIKTDFTDLFLASDTVVLYIPLAIIKVVLFLLFFIVPKLLLIPIFAILGSNQDTLIIVYFAFIMMGTISLCIKLFVDMIINFSSYFMFDQKIDAFASISKSKDLIFSKMWEISIYFFKVSLVMIPVYIIVASPFLFVAPKIISFIGELKSGKGDFQEMDSFFNTFFDNFLNELTHSTFFIYLIVAIIFFMIMSSVAKIISNYFWAAGYLKYYEEKDMTKGK
ncbi:MAG: hypothetical protein C0601_06390 [Candidatus Muiribacterium halophilum]|uniref:Uncharacterized protein n=1 Tax=Muiribacterium halophilum TaxID=2053465 RepID=A0A2N5ZGB3_MUIH1|nr:MAG: hypothetical protein C0601_06390 [Candidatus Muirbacterium halophilum]